MVSRYVFGACGHTHPRLHIFLTTICIYIYITADFAEPQQNVAFERRETKGLQQLAVALPQVVLEALLLGREEGGAEEK